MNPAWGVAIEGGFFDEERHLYRCSEGIVRPSSTQVFDILGMSDFSNVTAEKLAWKREYGNAVHAASLYMVTSDLDWDSLDEAIIPAVTGIEQFLKKHEFVCEAAEERKIRTLCGMKYGTTLDYKGTLLYHGVRKHAIVDWKTGTKPEPTWTWQVGSYYADQPKVEGGWIGLVGQVDEEGLVRPHWVLDLDRAKREFGVLLAAANLKLNHNLATLKR